jgi:hypothetical protein
MVAQPHHNLNARIAQRADQFDRPDIIFAFAVETRKITEEEKQWCLDNIKALEEQLGHTIHTSPLTQYVGALGAALFAYKKCNK